MIQIGIEPRSTLGETPPPTPDEAIFARPASQSRSDFDRSAKADDGPLFVSPPPLPFPRVFPGL
jgi:hypothetical protein